ncbi:MAG: histidine phosphatase family protein [Desulfobacter sp.]|nr:MAG: histidine phosphatase family protein [Desulfobacter sp.]
MDFTTVKNRYYVMRHGQSLANVEKIIVSSPENGIPGYGLSQTGKAQAAGAIEAFKGLDEETVIVSSDFKRARETAQIVDNHLSTRGGVTCIPQLRERFFGDFELTGDENYPRVWEGDAQRLDPPPQGVEGVNAVLDRVQNCILNLENQYENKDILLVSHGDTLQIFLTWLKGWDPHRHREIHHLDTAEIRQARP